MADTNRENQSTHVLQYPLTSLFILYDTGVPKKTLEDETLFILVYHLRPWLFTS